MKTFQQFQEEKDWIKGAVKRPGAFTKKAKAAGMSVQQFAKHVDANKDKYSTRTERQANLAQTFAKMRKEEVQIQEMGAPIGNSAAWQKNQLTGITKGLEKVRKLPGQVVDAAKAAQAEAEAEKDKAELEKDREEERKERSELRKADERRKEELHRAKLAQMKQQTNEVYDPEVQGRSQIRQSGEGGRIGKDRRKSEPERRRMKATGGGESKPVSYKDRKDIGGQKQSSTRVQQPEKSRDDKQVKQTYADKIKAERRAAAQARIAAKKSGGEVKKDTTSKKDIEKQASTLLSKKTPEKKVSPDYKPQKASGLTRKERMSRQRKGEAKLRGIMKDQETTKYKKETGTNPDAKGRTKIMARVHKRMSS